MKFENHLHGGSLDLLQKEGVEKLLNVDFGSVQFSVGSGKSWMLAALASSYYNQRGKVALIVVPKRQLLRQLYNDFRTMLPKFTIGRLGEGHREYTQIVIGTPNTLATSEKENNEELSNFLKEKVGAVLLDECHHFPANTWSSLPTKCSSLEKLWAVSGKLTFHFEELSEMRIEALLGKPLMTARNEKRLSPVRVVSHDKISKSWKKNSFSGEKMDGSTVTVFDAQEGMYKAQYLIDGGMEGVGVYTKDFDLVKKNKNTHFLYETAKDYNILLSERNRWAIKLAVDLLSQGKTVVISTGRKVHLYLLSYLLEKRGVKHRKVSGDMSGAKQQRVYNLFQEGEIDLVIANYYCLMEGTNIPRLTDLIRLDGMSGEQICEQMKGRVERTYEGKDEGTIHLPGDFHNVSSRRTTAKINKYYKKVEIPVTSS